MILNGFLTTGQYIHHKSHKMKHPKIAHASLSTNTSNTITPVKYIRPTPLRHKNKSKDKVRDPSNI